VVKVKNAYLMNEIKYHKHFTLFNKNTSTFQNRKVNKKAKVNTPTNIIRIFKLENCNFLTSAESFCHFFHIGQNSFLSQNITKIKKLRFRYRNLSIQYLREVIQTELNEYPEFD